MGSRRWVPLLEQMILGLESSNPRGALCLQKWWQSRCALERKRRQGSATGKVLTEKKAEIFITLVRKVEWEFDAPSVWRTKISLNVSNHDWN